MHPEPSEQALLDAIAHSAGDERRRQANELFERHYAQVSRWCIRFTGSREEAADLAQETFIKAYRHLDSFNGGSRFSTWLYAIARNEWLTRRQRQISRPVEEDDDALDVLPSPMPRPDAAIHEEGRRQQVQRLLTATLDDVERRVFTLHYGDDMTLDQITRLLGLPNASGAKAYIVSARRKLARAVQRIAARENAHE